MQAVLYEYDNHVPAGDKPGRKEAGIEHTE